MNTSPKIHILQTDLEGRFVGNRGKQFQSGVMEESWVPEVSVKRKKASPL
jgi:hypothetical protein